MPGSLPDRGPMRQRIGEAEGWRYEVKGEGKKKFYWRPW